ncbi:MAG: hypothetical protein JWO30_4276 [Fibrobacteres bacterium]|nr:hypothetical protein [Fibrobacterota bacterium]
MALAVLTACNGGGGGGGGGAPVQVGSNLNTNTLDNPFTCANGYPIQFPAPSPDQPVFYLAGAQSCLINTWFPGAQPLTSGTVVSANIAVGNVTGLMRFVKMRALYKNPEKLTCCSVEAFGPTFTPTPNSVTTVTLNFPMTEDHVPADLDFTTIAATDLVGLEVLAPNVPIPGMWNNFRNGNLMIPTYIYLPSFSERGFNAPTQNLRSEGSYSGFIPAYNLNFVAGAASGASPTEP